MVVVFFVFFKIVKPLIVLIEWYGYCFIFYWQEKNSEGDTGPGGSPWDMTRDFVEGFFRGVS